MPSSTFSNDSVAPDVKTMMPPPIGDSQKAEKYINWIIDLIGKNKLMVSHSDLSKYQPSCLEDHYRVPLKEYEVEVSHSKHPDTSADLFVMLFNNLKLIGANKTEKVILAFIYLTKEQFLKFKEVSDTQIEQIRMMAEEQRFKQAMTPIDGLLEEMGARETSMAQEEAEKVLDAAQADQANSKPEAAVSSLDTPDEQDLEPAQSLESEEQLAAQPTFQTPVEPIPTQPSIEPEPAAPPVEDAQTPVENPISDLPPVPPVSLSTPEAAATPASTIPTAVDASTPPDHLSQLAEVAALAAPTPNPDATSQNVYLTGDLGYQIPQTPLPTASPEPTTPPAVPAPEEATAPVIQSQSSSLFQGGQNENNLFINPASLNPADIKPVNPIPTS